jgi:GR25 family glycosyltransferase involved in LPS biosynthesis
MTFGATKVDGERTPSISRQRKLRPLIITMGGARKEYMEQLFATMKDDFETPVFSPGIPSRSLRNRHEFLTTAFEVGLVPNDEWKAIKAAQNDPRYQQHPERFWECLNKVPVKKGRRGSDHDVKLHYSRELWQKAKTLNRGRATLACFLAHLRAMKLCAEGGYDFILEDNVRASSEECAQRVWEAIDACHECERENKETCHLRYYGFLGSMANLHWILTIHTARTAFGHESASEEGVEAGGASRATVFPFPITQDFDQSPEDSQEGAEEQQSDNTPLHQSAFGHQKPGGTPIWGAYAYWISQDGLQTLLEALRMDVGAMLWKGKRMRAYVVKPIDKVLPRQIIATLGRSCIHVTTRPAFFRAPMLTSKIHPQWDAEFCKSTEYQMEHSVLSWSDLWLSDTERRIVHRHNQTGEWLTMDELAGLDDESEADDQ